MLNKFILRSQTKCSVRSYWNSRGASLRLMQYLVFIAPARGVYDPDVCGSLSSLTCCPQASIDRKPPSTCHDKSLSRSLSLSFCFLCSQNIRAVLVCDRDHISSHLQLHQTQEQTHVTRHDFIMTLRMKQAVFAAVTLMNCSVLNCFILQQQQKCVTQTVQIRLKW